MIASRNLARFALPAALALTCLLGWAFKAHCLDHGGWPGAIQYTSGCYSDAVPFWTARHMDEGAIPYFQTPMEYPVLTGAAIWIEATLAHWTGVRPTAWNFLLWVTIGNALLAFALLWMFRRMGLPQHRLWCWAAAPPLILYLGHNWDLIAVTLAVGAMLMARRNRIVGAAALAALGTAAKLFPILLLPLLGLQALFGAPETPFARRLGKAALLSVAAIGAWALINLPVALAAFENWSEFYRFSGARSGTSASIWEILNAQGIWRTGIAERNLWSATAFLVGAGAIVAIGWRPRRTLFWSLFPPILCWFLLTNKVYSPQFDLWIYPLLLIAAPRLWPVALFVIGDIAAYFTEFWSFARMAGAWPAAMPVHIAWAAALRGAAMLWLIADMLRLPPPVWLTAPETGR